MGSNVGGGTELTMAPESGTSRTLAPAVDDPLGSLLFDPGTGHRAPAADHGTAEAVDITAVDLGALPQWPLLLDECVRLMADAGVLRLRLTESRLAEKHAVARTIGALSRTAPELLSADIDGATQVLAMRVRRHPVDADATRFSFGIVSDGRHLERLHDLIATVRRLDAIPGGAVEMLVCGPGDVLGAAALGDDVAIVPEDPAFAHLPWITGKKNLLARQARHPNLILVHDRYRFPADFLHRMAEWGGDYSFLTCRALSPDGSRFPDWLALDGPETEIAFPVGLLDYGDYHPGAYVNGGIMIAKRDTILENPLCELLWWGEAEDVEVSRRLSAGGHLLRLAPSVIVESIETTPGYVQGFTPIRPAHGDRAHWRTTRLLDAAEPVGAAIPHHVCGTPAGLRARHAPVTRDGDRISIEIGAEPGVAASLHVTLVGLAPPVDVQVRVNGAGVPCATRWDDRTHSLDLRFRMVAATPCVGCEISAPAIGHMVPTQVIEVAEPTGPGTIVLGTGWWPVEEWGAWARSSHAEVLVREDPGAMPEITLRAPPTFADEVGVVLTAGGTRLPHAWIGRRPAALALPEWGPTGIDGAWHRIVIDSTPAPVFAPDGPPDARLLGPGIVLGAAG